MQFFSVTGDGETYFYIFGAFYAFGYTNDFSYLITASCINFHWSNWFKTILQDSRPQFDNPALAVANSGDCAGEYGNPSGHSLTASQFCLTMYLL